MQVPETPKDVTDLDLMQTLNAYAEGKASWLADSSVCGPEVRQACRTLHTNLTDFVNQVLNFILDRVNAQEMDMFTMHDHRHGMKVAHLMWHILTPERKRQLTPPEIGILVLSAYLHDAGMALTHGEREKRLAPDSDLWLNLENGEETKQAFQRLRTQLKDPAILEGRRRRIELELQQAEEAILTNDTRQRHATQERYHELLSLLSGFHDLDEARIPNLERAMSFDGDSFKTKLVDICVSHNESAEVLVERDRVNFQLRRFPREYPVGRANADLQLAAAALRLADILDFDRERTPSLLFHYLLPGGLSVGENISKLEWSKHLAISNWEINDTDVVFRGRCSSHIIHHAIVQFCRQIEFEISNTHAAFAALEEQSGWSFILPKSVKAQIHEEGYHYVPYSFELDDSRIYRLLMGGAIYDNPKVAVRELIQNAVDACTLRDALTRLYDSSMIPSKKDRIVIRYEEPINETASPSLMVQDSGTGMDAWLIEQWFLRVGRSYYSSAEFNKTRLKLRACNMDFAPVSEFGIGFLSCFLLADRVEVETAMWEPVREDTRKRHLTIDGPTRLIRVREDNNAGAGRFKGTRVTLHLTRGSQVDKMKPPSWDEIRKYIDWSCEDLSYTLRLEHKDENGIGIETVGPKGKLEIEPDLAQHSVLIPVNDKVNGIEGEIILTSPTYLLRRHNNERAKLQLTVARDRAEGRESVFIRGGFRIGNVPGLPQIYSDVGATRARIHQRWEASQDLRYGLVNLARNEISQKSQIAFNVTRIYLQHLIKNRHELPEGLLDQHWTLGDEAIFHAWDSFTFLEEFSAYEIYELARQSWISWFKDPSARHQGSIDLAQFSQWESGQGTAIPVFDSRFSIGGGLLACVLPLISNLQLNKSRDFVAFPPQGDWRESLKKNHDFIRYGSHWPSFIEYDSTFNDFLFVYSRATDFLNKAFEKYLLNFSRLEITSLIRAFSEVASGQNLRKAEAPVFARAIKENPDLKISIRGIEQKLSDFNIST